jgi:hypothetical protein
MPYPGSAGIHRRRGYFRTHIPLCARFADPDEMHSELTNSAQRTTAPRDQIIVIIPYANHCLFLFDMRNIPGTIHIQKMSVDSVIGGYPFLTRSLLQGSVHVTYMSTKRNTKKGPLRAYANPTVRALLAVHQHSS